MATRRWLVLLAWVLFIVGPTMFFINAEAVVNGQAVECDGSPMEPDQLCVSFSGGESRTYEEEKRSEARGERVGYAGLGIAALGVVLFLSHRITGPRRRR
ncbi:hypothetical protein ACL02R_29855 [Streptomyces sp. MS19]|uniref:hypothetical protein n=1 Tax=Streptomyces sp. MS19 TaxID=3385972 RepID=UPI0039A39C9E